jgi:hypothetical protein
MMINNLTSTIPTCPTLTVVGVCNTTYNEAMSEGRAVTQEQEKTIGIILFQGIQNKESPTSQLRNYSSEPVTDLVGGTNSTADIQITKSP